MARSSVLGGGLSPSHAGAFSTKRSRLWNALEASAWRSTTPGSTRRGASDISNASLGEYEKGIEQCQLGLDQAQDPLNKAVAQGLSWVRTFRKGRELGGSRDHTGLREAAGGNRHAAVLCLVLRLSCRSLCASRATPRRPRRAPTTGSKLPVRLTFVTVQDWRNGSAGQVALLKGETADAKRRLEDAVETFDALQVILDSAHTRLDLARLHCSASDLGSARHEFTEAHRIFVQLGLTHHAESAAEQAKQAGVSLSNS